MFLTDVKHVFEGLVGEAVTRVSIEPYAVRLLFESVELNVEGSWKLAAANSAVVDGDQPLRERHRFELWRTVSESVAGFELADKPFPRFLIDFTGGWSLEVSGDDDGLEDWSLASLDSSGVKLYCNGSNLTLFS